MVMKTRLIGTRIPEQLYALMEICAGDSTTIGDIIKKFLERYCSPGVSKTPVIRSNTDNPKPSIADLVGR